MITPSVASSSQVPGVASQVSPACTTTMARQRSYEAMILARSLDASIGQSEAFLGRFVISGDKDLGRIYFDDWRRAGTLLDALDQLGLRRAIATSSSRTTVRQHLAMHGLDNRFDLVVAAGDYPNGKPAPDPFLAAAQRLGVAPAFFIGMQSQFADLDGPLLIEDRPGGLRFEHSDVWPPEPELWG